ncbi:MAG: T9SS type A sorting domain-containing protein [Chitinophagales bacterium]|nr:T9SS type A sorting domain-containing protein [Chitinophagales bacterium]HMV15365.1 T9SS type A sorting domain-containing protein [Chitinophagales bacterium]HMX60521.1 T9SS type A sorting domain-containing protein [Chitinophagales bacterium]HMY23000.1 T9SS type A sorting domain-containing protein [Chitinophagales bacterium]HMZ34177.1 T9SS type A sorting domain-containing protein [Chitinophagales bacterium]
MYKIKLKICICVCVYLIHNAKSQSIPADLGLGSKVVWNKDLMGFNLGDFSNTNVPDNNIFDIKNNGSGNTYNNYTSLIEDAGLGKNILYRFYTGEFGNCYNRWYGGAGGTYKDSLGNMIFDPYSSTFHHIQYNQFNSNLNDSLRDNLYNNYFTYNDTPFITYQTTEVAKPKNNIIFPFIKLVTNNRAKNAKTVFNLPITAHYRDYRTNNSWKSDLNNNNFALTINFYAKLIGVFSQYADNYSPRKETFSKSSVIAEIYNMNSLNTSVSNIIPTPSNKISPQFKEIVLQNLAAFSTLIQNRVKVVHIELGNELYSRMYNGGYCSWWQANPSFTEFSDKTNNNIFNDVLFYNDPCNNTSPSSTLAKSVNVYGNLIKMYMALIRELVENLWSNESDEIKKAFYLDIKNNLKFGVPMSGRFPNLSSNGFASLDKYLYDNKSTLGFDAFIQHPYYKPNIYNGTLDVKYDSLKKYYSERFNTYYKQTFPKLIRTNYPNISELWFTEWAHEDPNNINNTLLEGMNYIDEFMNFWDLNSNLNLTDTLFRNNDILKVANHHMLWDKYASNKQLINIQYNQLLPKYRTMFYAHKLLLPIMDNNTRMINKLNGGFVSPNSDIYFRSFESPQSGQDVPGKPGYEFANKIYIYYNNKNNNTTPYTFNLNSAVQSLLANCFFSTQIYSVKRNSIYANKLYISRGKGPSESSDTITDDPNKTVQYESDLLINDINSWNTLPIAKYSAGYYEITIIRETSIGTSASSKSYKNKGYFINSLFPNPLNRGEKINIKVNGEHDLDAKIYISSIDGKLLKTIEYPIQKGENYIKINSDFLSNGIYILHSDDLSIIEKIIVKE